MFKHYLLIISCTLLLTVWSSHASQCSLNLRCGGEADNDGFGNGIIGPKGSKGDKGENCQCSQQNGQNMTQLRSQLREACPQTKYFFPSAQQTTNFLRVKAPIPPLSEVTICAWVTPPSGSFNMAIFSYANSEHSNGLLLWLDNSIFYLYLKDIEKRYDIAVEQRTHFCVAIDMPTAMVYVDGALKITHTYSDSSPIAGGGALIVGQDQDSLMGGFDEEQALKGVVENVMLWHRKLSAEEIRNVAADACACPRDWGIALTVDAVEIEGAVIAKPTESCSLE